MVEAHAEHAPFDHGGTSHGDEPTARRAVRPRRALGDGARRPGHRGVRRARPHPGPAERADGRPARRRRLQGRCAAAVHGHRGRDAGRQGRSTLSSPQGGSDGSDLQVGEQKDWLSLIDGGVTPDGEEVTGGIDVRGYTLRGLGDHIEVWVADDLSFPDGDCRNVLDDGALTQVTDEQAQTFADEFDENVLPKESEAFSVAPDRDGTKGVMDEVFPDAGYPEDYWVGKGDRTVALIDNVRDQNYYDPTNVNGRTYIAGSSSRRSTSSSTATS